MPRHSAKPLAADQLPDAILAQKPELLCAAAGHSALSEDLALAMLKRMDLPGEALTALGSNGRAMKHRKVRMALVMHKKTPRFVSLPLLKKLYTFELMHVALIPHVPSDVKRAAEDMLATRASSLSAGERMTLAKQGSTRTAAALLHDAESRIIVAALDNPRMTEMYVVQSLLAETALQPLTLAICQHRVWSLRKDVRGALLRNAHTPLAHAINCAQSFRLRELKELFHRSELPEKIQSYLLEAVAAREKKSA